MGTSFEEFKAFFRGENSLPLVTTGLISIIVVIYFLFILMDPLNSLLVLPSAHIEPWSLKGQLVFSGEYFRLLSSMFIHYNLAHVGSNLLFLLIYGLRYEELSDSRLLLVIFLVSGLAGNLLTVFILPDIYSAGASGAIFGVFGALLVVLHKSYPSGLKTSIFIAFIFFTLTIASDTNVLAHGGGLLTGFVLQLSYSRLTSMKDRRGVKLWKITDFR
ncbi:MAG: rhomboid family intramembrane serine protease [Candidatus Odinarchaeota archaeon]